MENIKKAETTAFLTFIGLVISGTLLHFAFDFFDRNTLVGAFTPVNESIWEHLKLIMFPSIFFGISEYLCYGKNYDGFISAKSMSTIIGMLFIIISYYTISGITGRDLGAVNIIIFIAAAAITSYLTYYFTVHKTFSSNDNLTIVLICSITLLVLLFIYFTFNPPHLELFRDPLSMDFGITQTML